MTHDDPKLTAYALGELDDPADRAAVEALLATDETARRLVEETRQTAAMLTRGLQATDLPTLTAAQRQTLAAAKPEPATLSYQAPAKTATRRPWVKWALATAACAALASAGLTLLSPRQQAARRQVALNPPPRVATTPAPQIMNPSGHDWAEFGTLKDARKSQITSRAPQSGQSQAQPQQPTGVTQNYEIRDLITDAPSPAKTPTFSLDLSGPGSAGGTVVVGGGSGGAANTPALNTTSASTATAAKLSSVNGQAARELDTLLTTNPTPAPSAQTGKDDFNYRFYTQLQSARDALGRNDPTAARVALADARKRVEEQSLTLTPQELKDVTVQLHFAEAEVPGTESYAQIADNPFQTVADAPLSTFSIDVDTASYANVRRFITQGQLPPADAVRIEELLNYFPYAYQAPARDSKDPFKATVEVAACPWNTTHRLARVAIKGKEIAHDKRPVSNLVFLIDVSGSMNEPKKLPLVKEGLKLLVNELTENDRISLVVYAGSAGLVLPSTPADPQNKPAILAAIDNLSAGGSTNGGQGIELAYRVATEHFIKGGTNRVLLATDGDWNVGITDQTSLTHLIENQAKSGVFLSVLGFGFGNLKDATMERLADKGNGHYAYIDDRKEARKVLVEEMSGTLVTIAKDVKIQVEFNPAKVQSYRLIGYENRMLKKEDFNNDKVDAGEIGAGHTVTALYEIVPASPATRPTPPAVSGRTEGAGSPPAPTVDPLKYQKHELVRSDELLTLKLRYKLPDADTSTLLATPVTDRNLPYAKASDDFKFAAAVAQYGMILRNSPHKGTASLDGVLELADEGKGKDDKGYRADFLDLVRKTKALAK